MITEELSPLNEYIEDENYQEALSLIDEPEAGVRKTSY